MTKEKIIGTTEQRKVRIGGSEFGTVIDVNPYQKRIESILLKAGVITNTFEGNEATRRGELLEDEIIELFEKETGLKVVDQQKEFSYEPNYCLPLVCHVDGITSDDAVFEAKTTDKSSKTWANGIPEYYKAQLEFNCYLSGCKKAYIAVGICDDVNIIDFKWYEYQPEMTGEQIIEKCCEFSREVEKYKSLGVVNSGIIRKEEIDNRLIDRYFELTEEIKKIKTQLSPLEDEKKIIENNLKLQIQNDNGIENDLYRITLGNRITSPSNEYKISRSVIKIELKGE